MLTSIDLSPLQACTKLQELILPNNQLTSIDLSPLKACTALKHIELDINQIKKIDITVLKDCMKLDGLYIDDTVTLVWLEEDIPNMNDLPLGLQEHYSRLTYP